MAGQDWGSRGGEGEGTQRVEGYKQGKERATYQLLGIEPRTPVSN